MAVGSGTPYNIHIGNGVTTTFAYGFTLLHVDDLVVTIDGVATSSYTVTGLGVAAGGTVVFSTAPANGAKIILQRVIQLVRATDYQDDGDLLADTLNADFNRLWMAIQGVSAFDVRGLRAPFPEVLNDLPAAADRADKILTFDSAGQPILALPVAGTAGALAADLASRASATKGAGQIGVDVDNAYATGTLGYRARNWVELEDFFLAGEADWSGAALRACVWCFQNGATLRLRPKVYAGANIEVHGNFSVEGNGATVDFLGVGNTYIAGTGSGTSAVPTAWPGDSGGDPSTLYTVQSWNIASPVAIGDDSITFASTTGMVVGSTILLAGNPSTASSPGNYIPANFEFAQILSIVGNVVTLNGKARNTYTTAGAAFYSPGLARNGKVSNLRLKSTSPTPYQAVVRSAVNYELENIEFAGRDALGAATFVEGFKLKNARATGCGGNWSFARGTVSAELDGLTFQYRSTLTSETSCVFVEESLYDVSIRNVRGFGASFSVRVLDMASTNIKRSITIYDSTFDTTNSPGGATAPFQCGTAAGVDIEAYGSTFVGAVVTPNASIYPGVTGTAMGWVTSNQTTDRIKFTACHFKGTTTGAVFKKGSGALGQVVFDEACTFETIDAPIREYTPMGAWLDMSGLFAGGVTVPAGSTARWRYTPWDVTVSARIQLNGLATGSTFFNFPSGLRPQVEKRFVCATDATDRIGIVRVLPGGALIYVGSTASPPTYLDLQFTFPID